MNLMKKKDGLLQNDLEESCATAPKLTIIMFITHVQSHLCFALFFLKYIHFSQKHLMLL